MNTADKAVQVPSPEPRERYHVYTAENKTYEYRHDPSDPSLKIIHILGLSGWQYPWFERHIIEPNTAKLIIRGVRLFSFRYYTDQDEDRRLVHSFVPFSDYRIIMYDARREYPDFGEMLRGFPELNSITEFLKVSTGEFVHPTRWTQDELAHEKEVIAVYNRTDKVEQLLADCKGLEPAELPPELEVGKYDTWIPDREDEREAWMKKHFQLRSNHFMGPDPLYIDELRPPRRQNGFRDANLEPGPPPPFPSSTHFKDVRDVGCLFDGRVFIVPYRPTYTPIPSYIIIEACVRALLVVIAGCIIGWTLIAFLI